MKWLTFLMLMSLQMFEESDKEMQGMVRQQMREDNLDMPEDLAEVSEIMPEEEAKRYYENYRKQV